ncbi:DUF2975 domain-containing protein [Nonomuraea typhae]|uniref:DUF2975 domain-containing protein n=1 Tax=Nonomuraea typhae TaxID=2603600 RepID=UPI0012FBD535|nr:DUF2975 domain-containing protein [Nonomuraea typhae]
MRWIARLEIVFTIAFVFACLGGLGLLLQAVSMAFFGNAGGIGVVLTVPEAGVTGTLAEHAAFVGGVGEVMVRSTRPSPPVAGLYLLDNLPWLVTGLLALLSLVRALRLARSGDRALFSARTAGHLRTLGWTLIIGTAASSVLSWLAKTLLSGVLLTQVNPVQPPSGGGLVAMLFGAAALGIAEIVRRGLALLEEVEATI